MSTPSHIATGYLLAYGASRLPMFSQVPASHLLIASVVASNIPDIDAWLFGKIYDHRSNSPFHYPFTWWIIFMTSAVSAHLAKIDWFLPLLVFSAVCVIGHFILDTFGVNAGILWLAPFDRKEYSFLPITLFKPNSHNVKRWLGGYIRHRIMFLEVFLCLAALVLWTATH